MRKLGSTLPIAAALLMFLSACAAHQPSAGLWREIAERLDEEERRSPIAPACPTPTSAGHKREIVGELQRGIAAGAAPSRLATEWERLNEGAQACAARRTR